MSESGNGSANPPPCARAPPVLPRALLLLFLAYSAAGHAFTVCKNHQNLLGITALDFQPDPPRAGEDLRVTARGRSQVPVAAGSKVHLDVKVFGVVVSSQVLDVCELVQCPISAGEDFDVTISQPIPFGTPTKVNAMVRVRMLDATGAEQTCLESTVQVAATDASGGQLGGVRPVQFLFDQWTKMHPLAKHNLQVFAQNWEKIVKHNADPKQTFTMEMNEFGSLTVEEFAQERMGVKLSATQTLMSSLPHVSLRSNPGLADPPSELDWTELGKVTKVKNQGRCGSCWAFSAMGAIESAFAIKTGKLVELSEQELVSCDTKDGACQGGLMDTAFDYLIRRGKGVCTAESYPYTSGTTGTRGTCNQDSCEAVEGTVPKSFADVGRSESALLAAVASHGPVSVAIQADQAAFQFYKSGVMTGACGAHLDHGVLLVGYGTHEGKKFWKLKNSWGASWGEEGYIRIIRGRRWPLTGQCGIAAAASYPIFE
ncbi:hypothetical protein BASA81_004784 [Batrachochytrium salamandrivorans]|nr:hypothetical protein BASA81_004784 [Batrachochytrium salamandrivorans]